MKTNIIFYSMLAVIFGACLYGLYLYFGRIDFGLVFLAALGTVTTFFIIAAVIGIIWRAKNGVDLLATLETDPEKVKEHMLFIMQFGHSEGIKGALNEFNDIFRNYPQWEFHKWEVFRAWYKDLIDHALEKPEIYNLTMKDGSEYSKETDQLYDPDAPSWEQFDRPHYYDDDDDDEDEDDLLDWDPFAKEKEESKRWTDAISIGYGFAIGNTLFGGSSGDGGCSSGDSSCDCGG